MRSFLFQNTRFFSAVILYDYSYSEQNFYRPLLLEKRQFFRAASFSEQLLFRKTNLLRISISTEEFLFRSRQNIKFLRKAAFSTKLLPQKRHFFRTAIFPEVVLLEAAIFFRKATEHAFTFSGELLFQSSFFLKRATFSQYNISEQVVLHSFPNFPQLHFLFISQLLKEFYTIYRSSFLWINYCSKLQHMHSLFNSVVTQSIVEQLLFQ